LSHGDAADIQLKAEALANELGVLVAYREAVEYGAPWPPLTDSDSEKFRELIELENLRQKVDRDFRKYVDYSCCNTMEDCPIAK
jgi:hypothetical protein